MLVISACIGIIVRYVVPSRGSYGLLMTPAVATAVTAAVWAILLWAGFTFDGGWIWTISITAGVAAAVLAALLVPKRRVVADERLFLSLTGGKA